MPLAICNIVRGDAQLPMKFDLDPGRLNEKSIL
jgi:hypothetical protein